MALTSPAFAPGGAIPERHTCDGENLSPPLAVAGAPGEAAMEGHVLAEARLSATYRRAAR